MKNLPFIYFGIAVLMSAIALVVIMAADGLPGFKDPVVLGPDSSFKIFMNKGKDIAGDKFWFRDQGNSTSGSDWSNGWECSGT